jgi:hypothetical protein
MNEEKQIGERHEETGFEREDWNPRTVFYFLGGLAVACLLVYFLLRGMYAYLDARTLAMQPAQNPLVAAPSGPQARNEPQAEVRAQIRNTFPDPRLEENERQQIGDFRLHEEETLNSYGWVDKPGGAVHIPIERAMELIAQRGLPTRPQGVATEHVGTAALGRSAGQSPPK